MTGMSDSAGGIFRFKRFSLRNERSAMKVNTDACLLGSAMTLLPSDRRLLDIGTGTGVIAMMAAQRLSGQPFEITAIDIDTASCEEASSNFASSPWVSSLRCINVPLSAFRPDGPFDLIFSNPPYFENSLKNPSARDAAARHSDSLSWRDILEFASGTRSQRVSLVLPSSEEIPLRREAAAIGYTLFRIIRISSKPGKPCRRIIAEFTLSPCTVPDESNLCLLDESGKNSPGYASLLADFLTGSVTSELVEVNDVTVKTYKNGFGSNDFKEISFD